MKKLLITFSSLFILVALTACGGENEENANTAPGTIGGEFVLDTTSLPVIDATVNTSPNVFPSLGTPVTTVTATSASKTTISYILSGVDKDFFTVDENGSLYFTNIPYYSPAEDADGDNVFDVVVEVSDVYQATMVDIHITISDDPEHVRPSIESAATDYLENGNLPIQIEASTGATTNLNYYIESGEDAGLFTLDENTGELTFNSRPNFELPVDANGDNNYIIEIRVTDQTIHASTITKQIVITVKGVNEGIPNFSSYASLRDDAGNDILPRNLYDNRHYTMRFNDTAIISSDVVTLTLAAYDSNSGPYDTSVFSLINGRLSIQVPDYPSIKELVEHDYYVRIIATDEHGNSSQLMLKVTALQS